jgi:hypothetical protein
VSRNRSSTTCECGLWSFQTEREIPIDDPTLLTEAAYFDAIGFAADHPWRRGNRWMRDGREMGEPCWGYGYRADLEGPVFMSPHQEEAMTQDDKDRRFDDLLAALRHPDVDLPAYDEAMRRSLLRLGVLVDQRELAAVASAQLLPLDQFAVGVRQTPPEITSYVKPGTPVDQRGYGFASHKHGEYTEQVLVAQYDRVPEEDRYRFRKLRCVLCKVLYVGWYIRQPQKVDAEDVLKYDLYDTSYFHAFNDEPSDEDLREKREWTPQKLEALARRWNETES